MSMVSVDELDDEDDEDDEDDDAVADDERGSALEDDCGTAARGK